MNKSKERQYLELFKRCYPNFCDGEIQDFEKPDFLIKSSSEIVGVELTRIPLKTQGGNLHPHAKDSIQDDIVLKIRELLVNSKINDCEIHIDLTVHRDLRSQERNEIANKVYGIITRNLPENYSYNNIVNDFEDLELFPPQIDGIRMYRLPGLGASFVTDSRLGGVQKDLIPNLEEVIESKNKKLRFYHQHCNQYWLIIYNEQMSSDNYLEPSLETLNKVYYTGFDKVFLFNSVCGKVYELRTKKIQVMNNMK